MYHSHLLINVGDNPDRPDWNITRRWLRNLYRVHQRLCMAFPSSVPRTTKERIAAYCAPFSGQGMAHSRDLPGGPDNADVHHSRSDEAGFLFRIDQPVDQDLGMRRPVIIVQSPRKPDWDFAFGLNKNLIDNRGRPIGNAGFLLAGPPQIKEVSINIDGEMLTLTCPTNSSQDQRVNPGDRVRFRLRANPVYKSNGKRHRPRVSEEDFNAGGDRRQRAFIKAHLDWLERKFGNAADSIECFALDHDGNQLDTLATGWTHGWRTKYEPQPKQQMQWWSALFEGTFRVTNTAALKSLLESGIGPAKAFGFGLLSIARA
ncbi:MAG: type I-E CRISPR-associated protein Cas6/Cse3/CasE [Planctomycetaceae bacterium]